MANQNPGSDEVGSTTTLLNGGGAFSCAGRMNAMKYVVTISLIVAVFLTYGVGYCLMLKGRYVTYKENHTTTPEQPHYHFVGFDELPYDHFAGKIVRAFFAPANSIDKFVRPREWKGPQSWSNLALPEQPINPSEISANPN